MGGEGMSGKWVKGTLTKPKHECNPPQPAGDGKLLHVQRGDVWECKCGKQWDVTGPVVFNELDRMDMGTIRYKAVS